MFHIFVLCSFISCILFFQTGTIARIGHHKLYVQPHDGSSLMKLSMASVIPSPTKRFAIGKNTLFVCVPYFCVISCSYFSCMTVFMQVHNDEVTIFK